MKKQLISILLLIILLTQAIMISTVMLNVESQATYRGPWVGEVEVVREPEIALSVEKLIAGTYDVMFDEIGTATLYKRVLEAGMSYTVSYGLYYEITLNYRCKMNEKGEIIEPVFPNPSKLPRPEVEGKILFNPFCNPRIRYAMHFLIDREFIAERIGEGLLVPRYTAITPAFPDYGRLADVIIPLEMQLKYNFAKAREIIFEEMTKMGAEFRDGKWYYKGEPVILIFLIRVEDVRKQIGDYVASQLERLGFTVLRYYGRSAELAPYWIAADPDDGTMHLYTGGWITTAVDRDQSSNFGFFYTKLGRPEPLWQKIINTPEFYEVAKRLYYNEFRSLDERKELMARAIELSLTVENQRIFIANRVSVWARRPNVEISSDLAGGYSGSWLWPWTVRFTDLPMDRLMNARIKIAYRDLLIEPWNPIGGSNWIYDQAIIRATGELPYYPDPYSGLYWPHRVKRAQVYVSEDLPVFKTLDWVELYKVPQEQIKVPDDAWLLYDCKTKKIYTVREVEANPTIVAEAFNITDYKVTRTALTKTIVYYDDGLFREYRWHDGSKFDLAEFVYTFIITFDRACLGSKLYDSAYVPIFKSWFPNFRGFRIIQTDPLVIEYYTDTWYMDAEWIAGAASSAFWPYYSQGPGAWHVVELAAEAERRGLMAFTTSKAKSMGVDRVDLLSPKSLPILAEILEEFIANRYVPYPEVLGKYVTPDVALPRWQNLKNWYNNMGHMWIGNGPFYLYSASKERILLKAFREHVDPPNKYVFLAEPPTPVINAYVPSTIYYGKEARILIELTDKQGNPYPDEYVELIAYIIIHAEGFKSGRAENVGGGLWRITLSPEETKKLSIGTIEFRFIAVSKIVGIPSIDTKTSMLVIPPELILEQMTKVREDLERSIGEVAEKIGGISTEVAERIGGISTELAIAIKDLSTVLESSLGVLQKSIAVALNATQMGLEAVKSDVRSVSSKVDVVSGTVRSIEESVEDRVSSVEEKISTLITTLYVVIAITVVNLALAVFSIIRKGLR
ncbi:MAG: ABC transporter substrate-binding protein [Ignisphaera sp.]